MLADDRRPEEVLGENLLRAGPSAEMRLPGMLRLEGLSRSLSSEDSRVVLFVAPQVFILSAAS
jgi:hypothetical protein